MHGPRVNDVILLQMEGRAKGNDVRDKKRSFHSDAGKEKRDGDQEERHMVMEAVSVRK